MTRAVDLGVAALWALFWIGWLVAAVAFNNPRSRSRPAGGIVIRAGIFLLVLLLLRTNAFRGNIGTVDSPVLEVIGLVLFVLGLCVATWARVYIGRNWDTPMSEKADPELVTTGPYRYVRHPIYSGLILAMIGTTLAVAAYWLIATVLLGFYFVYSATVEEQTMTRLFPATYPAYKRSTKMLIPFVV
jgi:protein-S-isoprenylcysteine O-methyltransferase Ste14